LHSKQIVLFRHKYSRIILRLAQELRMPSREIMSFFLNRTMTMQGIIIQIKLEMEQSLISGLLENIPLR